MEASEQLTGRQQAVLEFITRHIRERGYPPTVREIGRHFDIRSPNGVMGHLRALEKKGLIRRIRGEPDRSLARAIELVDPSGVFEPDGGLPLAGRVAAGVLHEAVEQSERIDLGGLFRREGWYVLQVSGDSMIEAQIADGDYVVVRPQETARPGDMVVAQTEDGESTLKYWFPEKDHIRLQPANSSMPPIRVTAARVRGVVAGVVRKLA